MFQLSLNLLSETQSAVSNFQLYTIIINSQDSYHFLIHTEAMTYAVGNIFLSLRRFFLGPLAYYQELSSLNGEVMTLLTRALKRNMYTGK